MLRIGEPEGEVGLGEGDGGLFVVELEIEAGAGGFDVGEAWGRTGFFLRGGRCVDMRGMKEDALKVPLAVGEVDHVNAWVTEADRGDFDATTPERADAEGRTDGGCANNGLGAEGGILINDEVFKGEAGERQEIEADVAEMDGAPKAIADAGGDALLIAVEADEGRKEDEKKDRETRQEPDKEDGGGCVR